jgi:tetratricopeptide (TPR) repeat protein
MLFLGLLGTVLGVPIARRRSVDRSSRGIVAVCVAMTAYFLVHASVDWLDRMPAIAGPAFAMPFVALRLVSTRSEPTKRPRAWRRLGLGATVLGAMVLAVSLIPPWIAARHQERAVAAWRSDPTGAFADLDRAAGANPLSALPLLSKGTIAIQLGRSGIARTAFRDAIRREDNWLPHFQLALLDAEAGRFRPAGREIRRAAELSASDVFVKNAAAEIAQHRRLDPIALNRELLKLTIYRQEKLA